jgi:hypothetical protein
MRRLKLFLCWYFVFVAVVFLLAAIELFAGMNRAKDGLELILDALLGGFFSAVAI